MPGSASKYIPKSRLANFPKPLQSLYNPNHAKLSYTDLESICEDVNLIINEEMCQSVEEATRDQSSCKLWFTYRAGRVTASCLKQACTTNHALPSQSLVKAICYPEAYKFSTKATQWGCKHEKSAKEYYVKHLQGQHGNVTLAKSGLVINPKWPYLGASPDGVVTCSCCGKGVLKIKCPYCHRSEDIDALAADPKSCLVKSADGSYCLDKTHPYFYQVQAQIFICNAKHCDFCMCTFPSQTTASLHVERIFPDQGFWDHCVQASARFFRTCLLPELLGRWYTRPSSEQGTQTSPTAIDPASEEAERRLYCYCQQPEDGSKELIACYNPTCNIEWFHTQCLRIDSIPTGKWYCPDCRKLSKLKSSRK